MKKAICLLSGGLDSATCLYIAKSEGFDVIGLTLLYGQKHSKELDCAKRLAEHLDIQHHITHFELPWGGSSLTDTKLEIPHHRSIEEMGSDIPSTYVPARNSIFLAMAYSCAEACGAEHIFIGANILDYSGYPDCRPEYLESFEKSMNLGTKEGVSGHSIKIHAPLLQMNKKEIIQKGLELGVPYEWTWSCYAGTEKPCGECDSCLLRAKGFSEAKTSDPVLL